MIKEVENMYIQPLHNQSSLRKLAETLSLSARQHTYQFILITFKGARQTKRTIDMKVCHYIALLQVRAGNKARVLQNLST